LSRPLKSTLDTLAFILARVERVEDHIREVVDSAVERRGYDVAGPATAGSLTLQPT
jgi:hypothetical protein